jgi:hypothetical protein
MRVRCMAVIALLLSAAAGDPARAQPPTVAITSAGPLSSIWIGNELSCQIAYAGDSVYELYPSNVVPGDCGTFLAVGGVLFAPNFATHTTTARAASAPTPPSPRSARAE